MEYIIIGSSGGLGSFMASRLRNDGHNVNGIDIVDSETTSSVVDITKIDKFSEELDAIVGAAKSPVCAVMCALPANKGKYSTDLNDYLNQGDQLLTMPFNTLLVAAKVLRNHSLNISHTSDYSCMHHIINIGSVASSAIGFMLPPNYGAGKCAAHYLIKHLAQQLLPDGIICNTISPGIMARNSKSAEYIRECLNHLDTTLGFTNYSDVLALILNLTNGTLGSIKGHDFIVDNGLEHYSTFYALKMASDKYKDKG